MDNNTLGNWLWDAACAIRGPLDAPKFKDYILPLLFFKRLSDVYQDELKRLGDEYGDEAFARELVQEDPHLVRFVIPDGYTWNDVRTRPNLDPAEDKPVNFGVRLTNLTALPGTRRPPPALTGAGSSTRRPIYGWGAKWRMCW